jgi:excisionase family DNA binding protein
MQEDDELLTTDEIAKIIKVHVTTVRKMLRTGILKYIEIAPREYRVRRSELNSFLQEREKRGTDYQ